MKIKLNDSNEFQLNFRDAICILERERERDLLQLRAKSMRSAFKIAGYKTKENIIANTEKKNALPRYLSWYHFWRKKWN